LNIFQFLLILSEKRGDVWEKNIFWKDKNLKMELEKSFLGKENDLNQWFYLCIEN